MWIYNFFYHGFFYLGLSHRGSGGKGDPQEVGEGGMDGRIPPNPRNPGKIGNFPHPIHRLQGKEEKNQNFRKKIPWFLVEKIPFLEPKNLNFKAQIPQI